MRPLHITALICAVVALVVLAAGYFFWSKPSNLPTEPFALYEDGAYRWYRIEGAAVVSSEPRGTSDGVVTVAYPGKAELGITPRGLVAKAEDGSSVVLVERDGMTPDLASLAPDGSVAVFYNEVTNSLDAFSPAYQGESASYEGSIVLPPLPSYLIAAGAIEKGLVVVHSGPEQTFTFYDPSVEGDAAVIRLFPLTTLTP